MRNYDAREVSAWMYRIIKFSIKLMKLSKIETLVRIIMTGIKNLCVCVIFIY